MLETKIVHQLASIGHLQSKSSINHYYSVTFGSQGIKIGIYVHRKCSYCYREQYMAMFLLSKPEGHTNNPYWGLRSMRLGEPRNSFITPTKCQTAK